MPQLQNYGPNVCCICEIEDEYNVTICNHILCTMCASKFLVALTKLDDEHISVRILGLFDLLERETDRTW